VPPLACAPGELRRPFVVPERILNAELPTSLRTLALPFNAIQGAARQRGVASALNERRE